MTNTRQKLLSGFFWSALEKYSSMIIGIVISMILSRILSPGDYGVVAIATVIIIFLQIFCSLGIAPAIIQKKELNNNDINSIYSFTIYIGLLLSLIFYLSSFILATFYKNKLLIPVCQILSIQVFFSAANMVPNALMLKNLRFKEISQRTVTLQVLTGLLSITAAFKGGGVYSLLISPILSGIGIFIWNRMYYPLKFYLFFSISSINKIFSYSLYSFLFECVNYFSRNLDKLIIGKYLSVSDLGYYEKSYRLMQMPLSNLTSVINPVLQPVFSEYQNELDSIRVKYEKLVRILAIISFPLGTLLFFCAEEIIIIMFGCQWYGSILSFRILSMSIPLQLILSTTGSIYLACNANKEVFYVAIVNSSITIIAFIVAIGLNGTIESIALGWTISSFFCFFISYSILYIKIFHVSIMRICSLLILPFLNSCLLVLLLCAFTLFSLNIYLSLILKVLLIVIISICFIHCTGQLDFIELAKKYILTKSNQ